MQLVGLRVALILCLDSRSGMEKVPYFLGHTDSGFVIEKRLERTDSGSALVTLLETEDVVAMVYCTDPPYCAFRGAVCHGAVFSLVAVSAEVISGLESSHSWLDMASRRTHRTIGLVWGDQLVDWEAFVVVHNSVRCFAGVRSLEHNLVA